MTTSNAPQPKGSRSLSAWIGKDPVGVTLPALGALGQHPEDQVDAPDLSVGQGLANPRREDPGPATDVEDPDRLVAELGLDPADDRPVRRPEQEPLQDAPVVALAPAGEFFVGRLALVVNH